VPVFCTVQVALKLVPATKTVLLAGLFDKTRHVHSCGVAVGFTKPLPLPPPPVPLPVPVLFPPPPVEEGLVAAGTLVLVAIKNRIVAVGVGVTVEVLVGEGTKLGVALGGNRMAVCVWAAIAVCTIIVSIEPGPDAEGGGVTSAGVAQPKMTNITISHKVRRRTLRLFITPPRYTFRLVSFQ
jgi:hypothetical protein